MKYIGTMHSCICQVIIWTPEGPISYASESLIVIFLPWYNCCVYVLNGNKMFLNLISIRYINGLVAPFGDVHLDRRWFRQGLVASRQQDITWTNVDLYSVVSSTVSLRTLIQHCNYQGSGDYWIRVWRLHSGLPGGIGLLMMSPTYCSTHWGRGKMDAISQTTLSNISSWMKMLEFRLIFHWSMFPRDQSIIFVHWFIWTDNGRFPNRTLYLRNVPTCHWYHSYTASFSLL